MSMELSKPTTNSVFLDLSRKCTLQIYHTKLCYCSLFCAHRHQYENTWEFVNDAYYSSNCLVLLLKRCLEVILFFFVLELKQTYLKQTPFCYWIYGSQFFFTLQIVESDHRNCQYWAIHSIHSISSFKFGYKAWNYLYQMHFVCDFNEKRNRIDSFHFYLEWRVLIEIECCSLIARLLF